MNLLEWTIEENNHAYSYGWAIFHTDTGEYQLQALDDPEMVCEDHGIESKISFKGEKNRDYLAALFVQDKANEGDVVCRKAIEFLIASNSKDVALFNLKNTWGT